MKKFFYEGAPLVLAFVLGPMLETNLRRSLILSNGDFLTFFIKIYEVCKVILRESSENDAMQAAVAMQKGTVASLTPSLAIAASKLSLEYNLPMADSIVLATAREFNAVLWTQDSDFKNISNVRYFPKK